MRLRKVHAAVVWSLPVVASCALDQVGSGPGDATSTSSGSSTSTGDPAGPASGATTPSSTGSAGGDTSGQGAGGASASTSGGGTSSGGGGDGGAGLGGAGQGGSGGAPDPFCGNGIVEPPEQCDDAGGLLCDDLDCVWEGECGSAAFLASTPGGLLHAGDTSAAAVDDFGACFSLAPTALHSYTTGPFSSRLQVTTLPVGGSALGDVVLSVHQSCADPTLIGVCQNVGGPGFGEEITTDYLPPNTTVAIAVAGFNALDVGPYELRIREHKLLFVDDFEAAPHFFSVIDSGADAETWAEVTDAACLGGGRCFAVDDRFVNVTYQDELLEQNVGTDATLVQSVSLNFYTWGYDTGAFADERLGVEIGTGGSNWTEVSQVLFDSGAFVTINLDAYAGLSDVRARFRYTDGGGGAQYWYVDQVQFTGF